MLFMEAVDKVKAYLHTDSDLPGEPGDYKLAKDLQYRLSRCISRLTAASVDIDDKTIYLYIEGWLTLNPTRSALQWDLGKEAFRKQMSGE